ncbi:transporter substrate-binding domain-containing protein [Butyrivibrio sp. WCE2006]|uniref:transporter substrate-binding domain-containing protein n=1 Tax=Butyrivibrio sp. WCE2006 TaxID=1410611 RepID=UPI0005D24EC4|nr:transporter substrate-binding domain-containing protein [Butyrivibrio sp. WCE2006]
MKRKLLSIALTLSILGTAITGCGKASAAGGSESGVKKIVVGAVSTADKFGTVEEDGTFDGYEVALLKAVDEKLEDYEFDIQPSDFNNILIGLDTGKIDLGTHMFEYNDERAEKYYFANQGYINFSTNFIIPVDSENTTWESLVGKIFGGISETDNSSLIVKKYNEEHPDKALELDYYGSIGTEAVLQSLIEGRWDAIPGIWWVADQYNEEYGNGKDIVKKGDTIGTSLAYYLYPKNEDHEKLRDDVDKALEELRADGTMKSLSEQYFGFDITPEENVTPQ